MFPTFVGYVLYTYTVSYIPPVGRAYVLTQQEACSDLVHTA